MIFSVFGSDMSTEPKDNNKVQGSMFELNTEKQAADTLQS